jgi:hypothetical protein
MNKSRWPTFVEMVKNKFTVLDEGDYSTDIPGEIVKFIEWQTEEKDMRAELHLKPKVLDKKTFYSNRIGSEVKEEFIYADDEIVEFTKFYEKSTVNDEWREMDMTQFM